MARCTSSAPAANWRAIPKDLPPRSTLYDYIDLWSWDGTLDRIHDAFYLRCREAASREASPTAAIIPGAFPFLVNLYADAGRAAI
jgi:transposase